jgi:hypothetical protein
MKDVSEAKDVAYVNIHGERFYVDRFDSDDKKERASKIAEQLKGMTIREAQEFLSMISESLIDVQTL